jgi:hypothetical protein
MGLGGSQCPQYPWSGCQAYFCWRPPSLSAANDAIADIRDKHERHCQVETVLAQSGRRDKIKTCAVMAKVANSHIQIKPDSSRRLPGQHGAFQAYYVDKPDVWPVNR